MEEQFVTYEIALALKELGFGEPCLAYWVNHEYTAEKEVLVWETVPDCDYNSVSDSETSAPLWQQVFDWFSDKYNLSINIFPISSNRWFYSIRKFKEAPDFNFEDIVKSPYPQNFAKESRSVAIEASILKAIELIKK